MLDLNFNFFCYFRKKNKIKNCKLDDERLVVNSNLPNNPNIFEFLVEESFLKFFFVWFIFETFSFNEEILVDRFLFNGKITQKT